MIRKTSSKQRWQRVTHHLKLWRVDIVLLQSTAQRIDFHALQCKHEHQRQTECIFLRFAGTLLFCSLFDVAAVVCATIFANQSSPFPTFYLCSCVFVCVRLCFFESLKMLIVPQLMGQRYKSAMIHNMSIRSNHNKVNLMLKQIIIEFRFKEWEKTSRWRGFGRISVCARWKRQNKRCHCWSLIRLNPVWQRGWGLVWWCGWANMLGKRGERGSEGECERERESNKFKWDRKRQ